MVFHCILAGWLCFPQFPVLISSPGIPDGLHPNTCHRSACHSSKSRFFWFPTPYSGIGLLGGWIPRHDSITVVNYFIAGKKETNCNRKFACCSLYQSSPLYMSMLQALYSRLFFKLMDVWWFSSRSQKGDWVTDCFTFAWEILVFCG